jgi:5-methylcytosine-specific restriction endonuclease McrA
MDFRVCSICGLSQNIQDNFYIKGYYKSGKPIYRYECKTCAKNNINKKYQTLKLSIIENVKNYRKTLRGKISRKVAFANERFSGQKININDVWNKFIEYGFTCAYCGTSKDITLDHIIPRSRGGTNTIQNILPCCKNCNNSKNDKIIFDTKT